MNSPKIVRIMEIDKETEDIKTIKFEYCKDINPGQFFMVWIPGVDEIPMSVSYINNEIRGFTFKRVGEATNILFNMKVGDKIGIRGPYGNGFKIEGKRILFVGGGTGIATLTPAVEKVIKNKILSSFIIGFKNKEELFFEKRIKGYGVDIYITTNDGSKGIKGFASDLVEELIKKEKFSTILTCGPEAMMKKILTICGDIPLQASLERYMKCGVGICSQCCIGDGLRCCVEGPIFDGETLRNIDDFGKFKRDASGSKIRIKI